MSISPLAGKPAPKELLVDPTQLEHEYYERRPDLGNPNQLVSFGTSGHRGAPEDGAFNEAHILAITQAICEHRARARINGPLFLGADTHAASIPALRSALEVLAANHVVTLVQGEGQHTPTPSLSRALHYSERTIKSLIHDIAELLGARTRAEAVAKGIRLGLI